MKDFKYAIVCVDDDTIINLMLSFQLQKIIDPNTTTIECYSSSEEALEQIEILLDCGIEIICILVDFQMPKMNGAELVRLIKSTHPNTTLIMLSGQSNYADIERLIEEKLLLNYISKPWEEENLFSTISPLIPS